MTTKFLAAAVLLSASAFAAPEKYVDIDGVGAEKFTVQIDVGSPAFAKCLSKNLELSGLFQVKSGGTIKVAGAPGAIRAEGRGKSVPCTEPFADDASARMAARRLSDAMCAAFGNQKGFACDRIVFLNRGKTIGQAKVLPSELCVSYPDGLDLSQLTSDARMTIFPRWVGSDRLIYINDRGGAPQIWEMEIASGRRRQKWSLKGSTDGVAVSPDGSRVAAILSAQGNPDLYVITGDRFVRLTNTPNASEGQPTWSPDGTKIAYVSNETRHPQIYVIDVASKQRRRLTSIGRENIDPDWGKDGRIAYITKRGGAQIAVMSSAEGDKSAELVTTAGSWEHPSWSRDMRHLVANRDQALFVVDTKKDGDAPRRIFNAKGNWISPCWAK